MVSPLNPTRSLTRLEDLDPGELPWDRCSHRNARYLVIGGWLIHNWNMGGFCAIPIEAAPHELEEVLQRVGIMHAHPTCDAFPFEEAHTRCHLELSWSELCRSLSRDCDGAPMILIRDTNRHGKTSLTLKDNGSETTSTPEPGGSEVNEAVSGD